MTFNATGMGKARDAADGLKEQATRDMTGEQARIVNTVADMVAAAHVGHDVSVQVHGHIDDQGNGHYQVNVSPCAEAL